MNPSDLIELDPRLGDCVLNDPLKATALFQSVSPKHLPFTLPLIQTLNFEHTVFLFIFVTLSGLFSVNKDTLPHRENPHRKSGECDPEVYTPTSVP